MMVMQKVFPTSTSTSASLIVYPLITGYSVLSPLSLILLPLVVLILVSIFLRYNAWKILEKKCHLPTVFYKPRFFNYNCNEQIYSPTTKNAKLSSSNITGILPRMKLLNGPYGVYATVYGLFTQVIHVAHPIPAKLILADKDTGSEKYPGYNHFKNFCGEGVFTGDGEDWKRKRTSVVHSLFSGGMAGRLEREVNLAVDNLMEEVKGCGADALNVVPYLQRSTVGIIYRYITHDNNTSDLKKKRRNESISDESKGMPSLQAYLQSVTRIRMIILAQSRSFWFLLPRIFYNLFSPMYRYEEETLIPIRNFADQACRNALPGSPLALLQNRQSHKQHTNNTHNADTPPVSKAILDEAITLLFAGQDTSAATLSWTLHLLSLHPQIQTKLIQEIETISLQNNTDNSNDSTKYLSKNTVSKMTYLDAVIKESMRLYPVAPFVVRKITHDISLPDTKATLPRGAFACIWIYGLHHNPKLWNKPEEFIPERWILPELAKLDIGQRCGAFMPFATGPRNCLGQGLANVILRIMLARILLIYEVVDERVEKRNNAGPEGVTSSCDNKGLRIEMQAGFTILPLGGVHLVLRPRDKLVD